MTVGCVDDENVHAGPDQDLGSRLPVLSRSNGCSDPKPSERVFGRIGIFSQFFDVLDGDETFQVILSIHDQQFFDSVLLKDLLRGLQGRSDRDRDEPVLGHHVGNRFIQSLLKTQVPVGQDPHQLSVLS